jgi:hypothetical protein
MVEVLIRCLVSISRTTPVRDRMVIDWLTARSAEYRTPPRTSPPVTPVATK